MNELSVKVAELHETANLRLRRRHYGLCNGVDFLCRNRNFTIGHRVT
jgi:hypothetical protein